MSASASTETALFLGNDNAAFYGKLMVIGGAVLMVAAVLLFALFLVLPPEFSPGQTGVIWSTTPPTLAGLILISAGFSQWRAPQQVDVDSQAVTIHSALGQRRIVWAEVSALQTGERSAALGNTTLQTVKLLGENGRALIELNSHVQPFDELVTKLWELGSIGRELEIIDTSQNRRRSEAGVLILFGPAMAALGIWVGSESSEELRLRNALQEEGAVATGTVEKHYKFNVTPRVEYAFRDVEGDEFRRNTIVASDVWSGLQEGSAIAVRYLPERPEYSRLVQGDLEDEQSHDPQLLSLAGPLVSVLGGLFFVAGALQLCGVSLDGNSRSKKRK